MGFLRSFFRRISETDEERLADEIREWAETIPGTVRINGCASRKPVRIAALVSRVSLVPGDSGDSLEVVLTDGTGEVTAQWTGRMSMPGLSLGSRVVVEGVLRQDGERRVMVNPAFEFSAQKQ